MLLNVVLLLLFILLRRCRLHVQMCMFSLYSMNECVFFFLSVRIYVCHENDTLTFPFKKFEELGNNNTKKTLQLNNHVCGCVCIVCPSKILFTQQSQSNTKQQHRQ